MQFSVLGSGSRGNSVLVGAGETHVLVDAGFSGRELAKRLALVGVDPAAVSAIVLTHEHGDHTRGAGVFARAHGTPLLMTEGTRLACRKLFRGNEAIQSYRAGYPVEIDRLRIDPFITVHDAADPVAVAVTDSATGLRLGIATDLGKPTVQIRHALRGCDALIVESNHDEGMLWSDIDPDTGYVFGSLDLTGFRGPVPAVRFPPSEVFSRASLGGLPEPSEAVPRRAAGNRRAPSWRSSSRQARRAPSAAGP